MISLLVSIVVFFVNDYMGARSGVDQSHLNNFTLVVLFVSGITSIFLLVKKRAIVLTTISLLVALGLLHLYSNLYEHSYYFLTNEKPKLYS